jgi:hypothetical protein
VLPSQKLPCTVPTRTELEPCTPWPGPFSTGLIEGCPCRDGYDLLQTPYCWHAKLLQLYLPATPYPGTLITIDLYYASHASSVPCLLVPHPPGIPFLPSCGTEVRSLAIKSSPHADDAASAAQCFLWLIDLFHSTPHPAQPPFLPLQLRLRADIRQKRTIQFPLSDGTMSSSYSRAVASPIALVS